MTRREAAIITAHTGHLVGYLDDFYNYLNELYGRRIYTVEVPKLLDDIVERSKKDFYNIKITE